MIKAYNVLLIQYPQTLSIALELTQRCRRLVFHSTRLIADDFCFWPPANLAAALSNPDHQMNPTMRCITQMPQLVSGCINHGIPGGSFWAFDTMVLVVSSYSVKAVAKSFTEGEVFD